MKDNTEIFLEEYEQKEMTMKGLNVGIARARDNTEKFGPDGENGFSHLGSAPTMYIRR